MFEDKITQIFVDVDDFVKDLDQFAMKNQLLGDIKSFHGFLNNAITALIAYQTYEKKPSIKIAHDLHENLPLLAVA